MGDDGVVVLRVEDIKQLGDFLLLAAENAEFRTRLQQIFELPDESPQDKQRRLEEFKDLFGEHKLVFSKERYDAVLSLYLERHVMKGEVYQMLRDFATAFGHPNIGVFN